MTQNPSMTKIIVLGFLFPVLSFAAPVKMTQPAARQAVRTYFQRIGKGAELGVTLKPRPNEQSQLLYVAHWKSGDVKGPKGERLWSYPAVGIVDLSAKKVEDPVYASALSTKATPAAVEEAYEFYLPKK